MFIKHYRFVYWPVNRQMQPIKMSREITIKQLDELRKKRYGIALLIMGIMMILFGIHELPTIWTFKSSLIPIKGTLHSADIYTTNATDNRGHSSRVTELIFYMNESSQKYRCIENIGSRYVNKKYEAILSGLKQADSISVWIKKSEIDELEPKVFQIDNERTTLLDFETVQTKNSPITAYMLGFGLVSIIGFFWSRNPDKFRKITGF